MISQFELASYQRAARTLLTNPLITETHPDTRALPLVRRWADDLRGELSRMFGYRLELSATTARLVRVLDLIDGTQPARTATGRPFDRRRYAYLALTLATLGRGGAQLSLTELADAVAADAGRIDGLGLSTEKPSDRNAFVDAVTWLEARGALRLADGNARRWADDPHAGEALYDIDRDVVFFVYRPSRVLQHIPSVRSLLKGSTAGSRDTRRQEVGQRARRALIEQPVVYFAESPTEVANVLRNGKAVEDVERLTGCTVERRAEGVALLDPSGSFSDRRFPGTGTVAQTALLLIGEIADRLDSPDLPEPARLSPPSARSLGAEVDVGLPRAGIFENLADVDQTADTSDSEGLQCPLLETGWLTATMSRLVERYGSAFAAQWRADPPRLLDAALDLLADLRMVAKIEGGVLALPLLARYRNVVFEVRKRKAEPTLFDLLEGTPE
ncbi:TIGR02678 family protein [Amycolatopsis thailandensis]|uniref:TIGR02678 family protein n=1 Tax=Amycolatopsis thailandensis TaxID=589330 RepID=UPI003628FC64